MVDVSIIYKYFPDLSDLQKKQFEQLEPFYKDWNSKVNVVSRKDIDSLYLHHVLHSLSIHLFLNFKEGSQVLDLGTGGGFPGIPLAILNPDVYFLLADGKNKKIKVVQTLIEHLGLTNVKAIHKRSEEIKIKFDFVLARAVTRLEKLLPMSLHLISKKHQNILPNGLIALKGGNLTEEIEEVEPQNPVEQIPISEFFDEEYFIEKSILYIQA